MALDDRVLIDRVVGENDERAFAELVGRYQSKLRFALRQLSGWDEALADDLAQETFIKAYRSLRQYRGDAKFFTWLYAIAYRCFAADRRARKLEYGLDTAAHGEPCTHATDEGSDLQRDFARALLAFPPQQRMVLHLHLQREFSQQEISNIIGCPLGTVKSHIQRGRDKLQEILATWHTR